MTVRVLQGDCIRAMSLMAARGMQVDSVVTDPPYHLQSVVKRFAKSGRTDSTWSRSGPHQRTARGFMGKQWDGGDIAFQVETWQLCFDLLKPGGYILAFSGARTYHRMACALEDAGFIVHPMKGWIFGQGFPKAHKTKIEGMEGWRYGTQSCKPALEPIFFGQKPPDRKMRDNILHHGTGAVNIDACRVPSDSARPWREARRNEVSDEERNAYGKGLAGSMAVEDTSEGRWPANVIHDGSDEVLEAFANAPGQMADASTNSDQRKTQNVYGAMKRGNGRNGEASAERRYAEKGGTDFAALPGQRRGDAGSAARFFYAAKADKHDRLASKHPTVKPVDLIRWCARLITPPKGLVLDPFAGSGTTGMACMKEGFRSILIEREAEYVADIKRRIGHVSGLDSPLFAEVAP